MSPTSTLVFFAFLFILSGTHAVAFSSDDDDDSDSQPQLTAYKILQSYDFPVGILPKGVTSYEFDSSTGQFTIYWNSTCSFSIEGYELRYKSKVTGVISKGRLSKLKGVSVKVLILWLNIVEVKRDKDEIDFSVGIASASFPIDNFEESPQCGCGFNCDHVGIIKTLTLAGRRRNNNIKLS